MAEIRAFVGHSFTSDDAALVQRFTKILDQIKKLQPNFDWEHAEPPEPKSIAENINKLLSDKNTFIGICTKKERVVETDKLSKALFGGRLCADDEHFQWKTSDWLIQEIGLAIGKDLTLILLLEKGVRRPGELQSDVRFITFEREHPEDVYGELMEMIASLVPKSVSATIAVADIRSAPPKEEEAEDKPDDTEPDGWTPPEPDWDRSKYEHAAFVRAMRADAERIALIDQAYLQTDDAAQGDNRASWKAHLEWLGILFGKGRDLTTLRELAAKNPNSAKVLSYYARALARYDDYAAAAGVYDRAVEQANGEDRLNYLQRAAGAWARAENLPAAKARINHMKLQLKETGSGETILLSALRGFSKITNDSDLNLSVMERILELDPSDHSTRFDVAFKHSECDHVDLALLHYNRIPHDDRTSSAWNNLGVAYDALAMPANSVVSYLKAEDMGETLAMSNLANKFLNAGFVAEAKKRLETAVTKEDFHQNVGLALARLKNVWSDESEKEEEVSKKAELKSAFYRQFGRALELLEPTDVAEFWIGPRCNLTIEVDGETFKAVGQYTNTTTNVFAGLLGGGGDKVTLPPDKFEITYTGTLRGHAVTATMMQRRLGDGLGGLLSSNTTVEKCLMIFDSSLREIKVMEMPKSGDPSFYALKRGD